MFWEGVNYDNVYTTLEEMLFEYQFGHLISIVFLWLTHFIHVVNEVLDLIKWSYHVPQLINHICELR